MVKTIAALLALIPATFAAAPAHGAGPITSFNAPNSASTMFFVSIPLDGSTRKQRETGYGFALQGKQQAFVMDTRTLKNNFGIETLAGLELKWIIAGAAAVATAAAVGSSSGTRSEAQTTAQATQSAAIAAASSGGTTSSAPTTSAPTTSGTSSTGTVTAAGGTTTTISSTGATSGVTSPGVAPCPVVAPSC
ncbi:MAG: hypothetical protein ACT4P4_03545 [Betaproteobacteria bacterium]